MRETAYSPDSDMYSGPTIPERVHNKAMRLARKYGATIYAFQEDWQDGTASFTYSKHEPCDGFTFCVTANGTWDGFTV